MIRAILLLAVAAAACSDHAQVFRARPIVGDLVPVRLAVPHDQQPLVGSIVPVSSSHALAADHPLALRAESRPDHSRRFWQVISGATLTAGVALPTTAPGATISLRPRGDARSDGGIAPESLVLVGPDGTEHGGGEGMDAAIGWDQLRAGGSPFAPGTSAFRLNPELGAGAWTVRADVPLSDDEVLVHVVEPNSALELTLRTDATTYLAGHTVTVEVEARHDGAWLDIDEAIAHGRSPIGTRVEIALEPTAPGRLRGELALDELEVVAGGTWEIQVDAEMELIVTPGGAPLRARRNARVAFGYGVASAGFDGRVEALRTPRGAEVLALGLDVVAAGRYAVAATVWGTDARGVAIPLGVAQSAAWLEVGDDTIELALGELLDPPGLGPQFELRDLRLVDQSRVALLHRQALAVAFVP